MDMQEAERRARALLRLTAYRHAKADLHAAIVEAHAAGMRPTEIAAAAGLSRQAVYNHLAPKEQP